MPILSSPQGRQQHTSALLPSAAQLLASLTEPQREQLTVFASKRLRRLATTPARQRLLGLLTPDELVHKAVEKILEWETDGRRGRKLSIQNRQNHTAFLHCMEGIINSSLSAWLTSSRALSECFSLDADRTESDLVIEPVDPVDLFAVIARRDLQVVLFARLREWAAASGDRFLPIIDYWEDGFLADDRIASAAFDPNDVYQVRCAARRILKRLARETEPNAMDGRAMLL